MKKVFIIVTEQNIDFHICTPIFVPPQQASFFTFQHTTHSPESQVFCRNYTYSVIIIQYYTDWQALSYKIVLS